MKIRRMGLSGKPSVKMAGRQDKDFTHPFILSRANIRAFVARYLTRELFYEGKYVFEFKTKRLALGDTGKQHRKIAELKYGNAKLEGRCGGFIQIFREETEIIVRLAGRSGYFGKPTSVDLGLVTSYVKRLLVVLGAVPYEAKATETGTVTVRANYIHKPSPLSPARARSLADLVRQKTS